MSMRSKERTDLSSRWRVVGLVIGGLAAVSGAPVDAQQAPPSAPYGNHESLLEEAEREIDEAGVELDVGSLLEALADHPDPLMRLRAAMILGLRGKGEAVGGLLMAAREDDSWAVREYAAIALDLLGREEGIEILRHELREARQRFRQLALARTLAQRGDPSGYGIVADALDEANMMHLAIWALAEFQRFEELNATDVLIGLAQAEEADVRRQARLVLSDGVRAGHVEPDVLEGLSKEPSGATAKEVLDAARERIRLKLETLETKESNPEQIDQQR